MTLIEFLEPLHEHRKNYNEIKIDINDLNSNAYKGRIKDIPYRLLYKKIKFWSYNFADRLNVIVMD